MLMADYVIGSFNTLNLNFPGARNIDFGKFAEIIYKENCNYSAAFKHR
jgi:hypothetical protein